MTTNCDFLVAVIDQTVKYERRKTKTEKRTDTRWTLLKIQCLIHQYCPVDKILGYLIPTQSEVFYDKP